MKKNYTLFLLTLLFTWVGNAQVTLTQSLDPVNVTDGGVACWSNTTGEYRENSFMRAYNLADFAVVGDFEISSVEYGQGTADDGKLITVNIYTVNTEALGTAVFTLIQSATHTSSAADDLSLVSVPLIAVIPAGSIIAFEVLAGDSGTNVGETFFPGFNAAGQNDPSYIKSTACTINVPTATSAIGFPGNQYVMNVIGNDLLSVDEFNLDGVSIFPNPVKDVINIELHPSNSINSTEIYSITGQLVNKTGSESKINIANLTAGLYTIKILTTNGTISKKMVKS